MTAAAANEPPAPRRHGAGGGEDDARLFVRLAERVRKSPRTVRDAAALAKLYGKLAKLYGKKERPGTARMEALMARHAPYRSLATAHLWASLRD